MSDIPHEDDPPPPRDLRRLLRTSYKFLGYSEAAARLGALDQQLYGKWCHRCDGIWFGLALEVECPRCGNRKG
jgi:hypothetical protein